MMHHVHFLRCTLEPITHQPSYTRLRASLEVDKDEEELYASSLKANVHLSSLSAFITAHEEGYAVEESSPSTSIRSIDANTLELNWCTSLHHGILSLDAYEPLGLLVVFGRDQVTFYINVLDLQTGAVRRVEETESATSFPITRMSPEGELILVRYDGEIVVILLSDFVEHGYSFSENSEDSDSEDTKTDVHNEHIIAHILPFDLPTRGSEKAGERYWVSSSFVGNGVVLLGDHDGTSYAIVFWRQYHYFHAYASQRLLVW